MQNRWMLVSVAALLLIPMTAALAQQGNPHTPEEVVADTTGMTEAERLEAGYHFDPYTGQWFTGETAAVRVDEDTGRLEDVHFPGWTYDAETRRWHDELRPGWSYDPVADRWYSDQRRGEVYDLRTGRWYAEEIDRQRLTREFEYDRQTGRYYDYGDRIAEWDRMGAAPYFDAEMGRWRYEPLGVRDDDRQARIQRTYRVARLDPGAEARVRDRTVARDLDKRYRKSAGEVRTRMYPQSLRPGGEVRFNVQLDPAVQITSDTATTAYLTPDNPKSMARYPVFLSHMGGNEFIGRSDITLGGDYWMVVRVAESGMTPRILTYPVSIR